MVCPFLEKPVDLEVQKSPSFGLSDPEWMCTEGCQVSEMKIGDRVQHGRGTKSMSFNPHYLS